MASLCPETLMQMAKQVNDAKNNDEEDSGEKSEKITEGQVIAIGDDKFVEFSIKDAEGKVSKYYWFAFIESETDLSTTYQSLTDKFVKITFSSQEFFDARIGEYRIFHVIQKLEITNK